MPPALISILAFLAVTFLVLYIASTLSRSRQTVRERLAPYRLAPSQRGGGTASPGVFALTARLEGRLAQADVAMRPVEFRLLLLGGSAVGFIVGVLTGRGPLVPVLLAVVGYLVPTLWLELKRVSRRRRLSSQVPDVMTTLSHALRAGYGLTQGIQAVSTDLPPPISTEFARTLRELGLGLTVEEALEGLVRRTKNQDLGIAVTGILINREVGGNLAELLDRVALTIRERVKLQNHIRILTIQGKISGVFAGLFPIFMAILFYILNPQYESVLFTTRMGQIAILVALTMQTIGALLVWRVVNIEA